MEQKTKCAACGYEGIFHIMRFSRAPIPASIIKYEPYEVWGGIIRVCPQCGTVKFVESALKADIKRKIPDGEWEKI